MHQKHVARPEIGQQVFGATAETGHGLALEPRDKVFLERKAQVFTPRFRFQNLRSLHGWLEATADGFDFG